VIYLLRHGDAEPGDGDDAARRLTDKGERQAEAAGRALAVLGAPLVACLTSPKVRAAGATIPRAGAETFWGGYSGIFVDPDGHPWEVAHNPHWPIAEDGTVRLG